MQPLFFSSETASKSDVECVASSHKAVGGRYFLIIVDAFSKYPDVIPVPYMTSGQTVAVLRKLCAQQEAAVTVVRDNGTQFTSHEFKEFCNTNAIKHILSPP